MKKQILFLILAVFAISLSTAYGQVKNPDIKVWATPTCTGDASKPAAGQEYTYTVLIPSTNPGYTGDGTYDWYVTQDVNLLDNTKFKTVGTEFSVAATGSSTYHTVAPGAGTLPDIKITWTAAAIATAKPYYLVVKYTEINTSGAAACATENIKVYQIDPQNTFWLDINPSTLAGVVPSVATLQGAGYTYDICAALVKTAVVTPGATPTVEYTYDDNVLYAVVHAAGYTGDWVPTLKLSGLVDDQAISSVTWATLAPAVAANGTFTSAAATFGNGTYTSATPLPASNAGIDILLTLTVVNNHHEGLTDLPVKISIDGSYTAGGVTYNDKSDATAACTDEANDADFVTETIKARPGVNPVAPTNFITPNAAQKP